MDLIFLPASSWTCGDIQTMGSGIVTATDSELSTIPILELENCLETLGDIATWSPEQRTLLYNRVVANSKLEHQHVAGSDPLVSG